MFRGPLVESFSQRRSTTWRPGWLWRNCIILKDVCCCVVGASTQYLLIKPSPLFHHGLGFTLHGPLLALPLYHPPLYFAPLPLLFFFYVNIFQNSIARSYEALLGDWKRSRLETKFRSFSNRKKINVNGKNNMGDVNCIPSLTLFPCV